MDRMALEMEEMGRNKDVMRRNHEMLIRNMGAHFGSPLNGYTFHYPLPSRFTPRDPFEGGDYET